MKKIKKRDLISIQDLSKKEIEHILNTSSVVKKNVFKYAEALKKKSVALVFQKPSNRTRVSFEIGIWQLGGKCLYLNPQEINLGKRESAADVAKTLSRYVSCIVARLHSHEDVIELSKQASVPIINGLTDLFHPCQGLTDIFTIRERFGKQASIKVAYVGDGNNVCHSLLLGCAKIGLDITIATPKQYAPAAKVISCAKKSGVKIKLVNSPSKAIEGANVVYTDTWVSMGQEAQQKKRLKAFKNFQINNKVLKGAAKKYVFMHCLPAHRGLEVTDQVLDGPHSVVFDQAENRMHVQKAILLFLLNNA